MNLPLENLEKITEIIQILKNLEQKLYSEKRWLNIGEAATYLGYSKAHLHKLKDTYFIESKHYYKKAGRILFDKKELDNWVISSNENIDPKEVANEILKDLI
ncbi:MAG: helix-turn-helix domain-containing protein [Campylobacterota bacterium]|nr:helix-turn-helix domain-containing protein [Campylobacterota bacterium]